MINFYDKNRFISKSTLARLADVSPRTFRRYLATRRPILDAMGISPKAQKLPPQAVRYICEDYCIDLPPELQDQEALSKSPLFHSGSGSAIKVSPLPELPPHASAAPTSLLISHTEIIIYFTQKSRKSQKSLLALQIFGSATFL